MIRKLLPIIFLIVISCSNKIISIKNDCNFPKSNLVPGGHITVTSNDYQENFQGIQCFNSDKTFTLVYPVPLELKNQRIFVSDRVFVIQEKKFRESRITIEDQNFIKISPESRKRIREEQVILNSKYAVNSDQINLNWPMIQPVSGYISSRFGLRRFINGSPRNRHLGLDIANSEGTKIIAPLNGRVIFIGNLFYKGNNIILDHGNGFLSSYSHLNEIFVNENEYLEKGQLIGTVGSSGRVTGPHLHFEIFIKGRRIDPEGLINELQSLDY